MRRILDLLYNTSGVIAGLFLMLICGLVSAQVLLNLSDKILFTSFGKDSAIYLNFFNTFGSSIPSYSDFSGFFLAAATFFALAYTLRKGGHVRVSLFIHMLPRGGRRVAELWSTAVGAILMGCLTVAMIIYIQDIYKFGDVTEGIIAIPKWIPLTSLIAGLAVFTIALIDEFFTIARGEEASYVKNEEGLLE